MSESLLRQLTQQIARMEAELERLLESGKTDEDLAVQLTKATLESFRQQAEEARQRVEATREPDGSGASDRPRPAWRRLPDGSYLLRDGRRVVYDAATGRQIITKTQAPLEFGPRRQIVQSDGHGGEVLVLGLYADPDRKPPLGAVFTPVVEDEGLRRDAERRARDLRNKARTTGLTAAEVAELNRLEAALAGTVPVRLGLPGGSWVPSAYGDIVSRDAQGRDYISVFGEQRRMKAGITGTVPKSPQEWANLRRALLERQQQLQAQATELMGRMRTILSGGRDPGRRAGNAITIGG